MNVISMSFLTDASSNRARANNHLCLIVVLSIGVGCVARAAGPPDAEPPSVVDAGDGIRSGARCCRESRLTKALLLFDEGSAAIRPSTAAVLDTIVAYLQDDLQNRPERKTAITLRGHAEAYERHPTALAAARAAAVKRYLVKHGIPRRAFKPPRHESKPPRDMWGNDPDAEPNWRRVDLHFLGGH
jgi:hypothetical protein